MNKYPKVSILLPIRNEQSSIEHCLRSIFCQDYPQKSIEVIVADGISNDRTRDVIQTLQTHYPNLLLVDNPGRIVSTGLNAALKRSTGEYIIRVDGHTIIDSDYISECVRILQKTGADNAGGRMDADGKTLYGKATAFATSSPFGVGSARFHYSDKEEWVDTVYLGAWPRKVFEKIGLFDEEMVRDQDDEFNYRLLENGGKILLNPKIRSKYTPRSTSKTLWKQYYQYGFWKVRVLQKHPFQMRPRQFIPPLFVFSLILFVLLSLVTSYGFILLGLYLGVYLGANLIASSVTAAKQGWQFFPLFPLIFAILHLSYGSGFLMGLVKFWNRWFEKKRQATNF